MNEVHPSRRVALWGALATLLAVVLQSVWESHRYPDARLDADLLSYLSYYRDWRAGEPILFGYTVPKLLPIVLFGPPGSSQVAWLLSVAVAALGGTVVFLLALRVFGLATAVIAAAAYVLDPLRSVLTLRSSVDLYIGVCLLAAALALERRAVFWASAAILIAALGKPIAALCALAALLVFDVPLRRRLVAAAIPFLALPAATVMNVSLSGPLSLSRLLSFSLPEQHLRFVDVSQGRLLDATGMIEILFREWFGGLLFARTWPLVVIGLLLFLVALRSKHEESATNAAPARGGFFLLVPLLLAGAYLGLSMLRPFVVFTRFFWPLAVALTILAAYGAAALSARVPAPRLARAALLAVFVAALFADRFDDYRWREGLMLRPFQENAAVADRAVSAIADDAICRGAAVVPLAYLPLAAWRAPQKLHRGELCAIEDWADGRGCSDPVCVLMIPNAPTTERARDAIATLVAGGYAMEVAYGSGLLFRPIQG